MSIFRIVQEALTNAVRHSQSGRVAIVMQQSGGTIHLRIEDWGIGFDTSAAKAGHFGLEGIRERARVFGGAARIDSAGEWHADRGRPARDRTRRQNVNPSRPPTVYMVARG